MDMFTSYAERGDAFAAAVERLAADLGHREVVEPHGLASGPADPASTVDARRTADRGARPAAAASSAATGRQSWFAERLRSLDRPLTSYYLVLDCGLLLVALGLVMVLSASSVESYRDVRLGVRHRPTPGDLGRASACR